MPEPALPLHEPAMVAEVMEALIPGEDRCLLDGTLGTGGHAKAWLCSCGPSGRVIGLDRDASALDIARQGLAEFGDQVRFLHRDYRQVPALWDTGEIPVADAVLFDLGLGSHQVDDPERGFSFRFPGPLDMRFDTAAPGPTAADLLARMSEPELARMLADFGEEPQARKVARLLVEARRRRRFETTADLAGFLREALPPRRNQRIDPATRTFQALRIVVNRELDGLGQTLDAVVERLRPGGRIAVIAYHSLEDRIVKHTFRRLAESCHCRRGDPCTCGAVETLELRERHARLPSPGEMSQNPRIRSARLRWGIRR